MSMVPDDLVELGRVASAYGVRGWIKIQPHAAGGETLRTVKQWWLKAPEPNSKKAGVSSSYIPYSVQQSRLHSGTVVALFDGFDNRDQVEPLKAYTVWVSRADFPKASSEEYYWVDLVGCMLYGQDENGQEVLLGRVESLFDNGAHAILQVERGELNADGTFELKLNEKGKKTTLLVPFVEAHVYNVNLQQKRLDSNWPADL